MFTSEKTDGRHVECELTQEQPEVQAELRRPLSAPSSVVLFLAVWVEEHQRRKWPPSPLLLLATQTSATLCTNPSPSITHEGKMASCPESSPAPAVHLPAVLIYFNNHIKKPPSRQEEGTTMVKPEEIKSEDVVSEISSTRASAPLCTSPASRATHDEEQMDSSSPAPSVQIPAVLIYFRNHSNQPPSHEEECKTVLKPDEIKRATIGTFLWKKKTSEPSSAASQCWGDTTDKFSLRRND
ncbi:hypothetical protein AOLI_G00188820 [Acnodon oligacanthus]